jgi:hypothetical protein
LLLALTAVFIACSGSELTPPRAPMNVTVIARTIDGFTLPAFVEEHAGAAIQLVEFRVELWPDGNWHGSGSRRPFGGAVGDTAAFNDNGWYHSDGNTILLHSNFTHTDWPGSIRGDTIIADVSLPIASAAHTIVFTP